MVIEDLGSTNGTMINGKRITGQQVLQPADIISIGSSVFGVKGFAAPSTVGVTQISRDPFKQGAGVPAKPPSTPSAPTPAPLPSYNVPLPQPTQEQTGPSRLTFLAIGGAVALVIAILIIAGLTAYFLSQGGTGVAEVPTVVITAPANNTEAPVNQPLTIQAIGSDPSGVTRMELWVSGSKVNEAISPAPQGQPTLTASFQWTPQAPGSYTLEVRAYNQREAVSLPTTITVNAIEGDGGETPVPTDTPEPIETVPGNPSLTTRTDLNVRGGPGIEYDLLGLLPSGTEAEIIGRDPTQQWWQIRFNPAADGRGWVAADAAFSTATGVANVPVVAPPPTPTGTPTETPVPPTATSTSTATSVPATDTPTSEPETATPTPTATPTGESETIQFSVTPTSINGGDCVQITWRVTGVREVYFNNNGVGGEGDLRDCPNESTTYRLRVVKQDGSEQTQEIRVEVVNPVSVKSGGTLTIPPNETLDIDDGDIPGDDFVWDVDDDEGTFEVQEGVEIAVFPSVPSLNSVSRSDCLGANYGVYKFIDATISPDPANALVNGRAICFKTNKGRIGKLRFPQFSNDDLRIEWLTWQ